MTPSSVLSNFPCSHISNLLRCQKCSEAAMVALVKRIAIQLEQRGLQKAAEEIRKDWGI